MQTEAVSIAIIDDNELYITALSNAISSSSFYEVIIKAHSVPQFFHQLEEKFQPDMILLDISLPEVKGFEPINWIRAKMPFAKIIVLSVSDDPLSIAYLYKRGASGYLKKSADMITIFKALDEVNEYGFHFPMTFLTGAVLSDQQNKELEDLSSLQKQFLQYACSDLSYPEIAEKMKDRKSVV